MYDHAYEIRARSRPAREGGRKLDVGQTGVGGSVGGGAVTCGRKGGQRDQPGVKMGNGAGGSWAGRGNKGEQQGRWCGQAVGHYKGPVEHGVRRAECGPLPNMAIGVGAVKTSGCHISSGHMRRGVAKETKKDAVRAGERMLVSMYGCLCLRLCACLIEFACALVYVFSRVPAACH